MRFPLAFFHALFLLVCVIPCAVAEKRVALVIGNAKYAYAGTLANPVNDAGDMATALKAVGFTVVLGQDLDKPAFEKKIREFAAALTGADAGVFFYAGHGLQVGGTNYLVPVDAELTSADALEFEMIKLDSVQRIMENAAKTNILFLDACRNNPLARNLARVLGTRGGVVGTGLAPAESGVGTLISFSTQPGNVAEDGTDRNSPFSGPLVRRLATPGEDIVSILTAVRNEVLAATSERQVPWENHALRSKFYFKPGVAVPAVAEPAPKPPISDEAAQAWNIVQNTTSESVLEEFVRRFPESVYARFAKARLEELRKSKAASKDPAPALPSNPINPPNPNGSGKLAQGWLGIQLQNVEQTIAESLGLKQANGALVQSVVVNGPAARSALRVGDVILEVNGQSIANARELAEALSLLSPGSQARLHIFRNGTERDVSVMLGERQVDNSDREGAPADNGRETALNGDWQLLGESKNCPGPGRWNWRNPIKIERNQIFAQGSVSTIFRDGRFEFKVPGKYPNNLGVYTGKFEGDRAHGNFKVSHFGEPRCEGTFVMIKR